MTSQAHRVDLRDRLDLPWKPSKLLVSVILRELISDSLHVQLAQTGGAYRDEAVEQHRKEQLLKAPLPEISPAPGKTVPAYREVEGAPDVPGEPGLALAAERVVKRQSADPLIVKGAYKVKVPAHLFVSGKRAEAVRLEPRPAALVPITLVVTGSVSQGPYTMSLMVPSWDADPKTGVASGVFAIDLSAAGPVRKREQTLFVYGFAFDQRFGPLPIGLVEE